MNQKRNRSRETLVGMGILAVLLIIAIAIFYQQFHFNPAMVSPESALSGTSQPAPVRDLSLLSLPRGMMPLTPLEAFTPLTLYEKINGRAELYLSAGFTELKTRRFARADAPDAWFEVFVYNMGTGTNAFAVFSSQRREDGLSLDLSAASAYRTENALFMAHGPYYVEIISSMASEELFQEMLAIAETFVRAAPAVRKSVMEKDLFPRENLDENSVSMITANAFGFERLDRIFIAGYQMGDAEATAFISKRETGQEAAELVSAFRDFLIIYGGQEIQPETRLTDVSMIEIMDMSEIIFSRGPYLAGVHEATDRKMAEDLANRLSQRLQTASQEVTHGGQQQ